MYLKIGSHDPIRTCKGYDILSITVVPVSLIHMTIIHMTIIQIYVFSTLSTSFAFFNFS